MIARRILLIALLSMVIGRFVGYAQTTPCAFAVSIARRDALGNVDVGLSADGQKWFAKEMKKYRNVCYAEQKADSGIWLYISVSSSLQNSATATTRTSPNGMGGTTSHTTAQEVQTEYPVYTLKVGRFTNGTLEVLRTFQRAKVPGRNGTVTGLIGSFGNPERDVITDAVKWLAISGVDASPVPNKQ